MAAIRIFEVMTHKWPKSEPVDGLSDSQKQRHKTSTVVCFKDVIIITNTADEALSLFWFKFRYDPFDISIQQLLGFVFRCSFSVS
jgi:hypothetical protein